MRRNVKLSEFAAGISRKLALLLGGALAVSSSASNAAGEIKVPDNDVSNRAETINGYSARPLPPKLILKQTGSGFKMIAQHDSHSSHSSHASHSSHSSHNSHSSHTSHASHTSGAI
jgi:hypothetical protein